MTTIAALDNTDTGKNLTINSLAHYDRNVPHIIKYMGSKRKILNFVVDAINDSYRGGYVCDLFGGTAILSGALGKFIPMHSNDIQEYSAILAKTYLENYNWNHYSIKILDEIVSKAAIYVNNITTKYSEFDFSYSTDSTVEEFMHIEKEQQDLINYDFFDFSHHLFIKNYSGTYWSYGQCLWIDALRKVADDYKETPLYNIILSSLMFAMSYNSQSTGHYAQYRDAKSVSSMEDILIYRQKEILPYFISKFKILQKFSGTTNLKHRVTSLDYLKCLEQIESNTLVYADPPYASVHYSRFYHALETLVKYDYPEVNYKGRYRKERHQSPFCKKTEVKDAFAEMFNKIKIKKSNMVLSYSNTGMISLEELLKMAAQNFGQEYDISYKEVNYKHSTMGRRDDKSRNVQEYLITAKIIQA